MDHLDYTAAAAAAPPCSPSADCIGRSTAQTTCASRTQQTKPHILTCIFWESYQPASDLILVPFVTLLPVPHEKRPNRAELNAQSAHTWRSKPLGIAASSIRECIPVSITK